jgi:predicted amidohydrolase YtcJ
MRRGLAHCARHGITSFHNMDGNFYQLELLDEIDRESGLPVRARIPFHMKNFMKLADLEKASEMHRRYRSERLSSGFVKMFMDGVFDSGTAIMADGYAGPSLKNGDPLFPTEQFEEIAIEADRRGLQIAVHAIGDGAVNRVLNGYEAAVKANGRRDSRHRIEHIEVVLPQDIERFQRLRVVASMRSSAIRRMAPGRNSRKIARAASCPACSPISSCSQAISKQSTLKGSTSSRLSRQSAMGGLLMKPSQHRPAFD